MFSSVLWHWWLADRKDMRPVKTCARYHQRHSSRTSRGKLILVVHPKLLCCFKEVPSCIQVHVKPQLGRCQFPLEGWRHHWRWCLLTGVTLRLDCRQTWTDAGCRQWRRRWRRVSEFTLLVHSARCVSDITCHTLTSTNHWPLLTARCAWNKMCYFF